MIKIELLTTNDAMIIIQGFGREEKEGGASRFASSLFPPSLTHHVPISL
jgi:hypothetical protein